MDQIPMFPDPADHQAFVRVVVLPWPMVGCGYSVVCPGCPEPSGAIWETYDGAWHVALNHRVDEQAWIPADELPWGPRAKWGPLGGPSQ